VPLIAGCGCVIGGGALAARELPHFWDAHPGIELSPAEPLRRLPTAEDPGLTESIAHRSITH